MPSRSIERKSRRITRRALEPFFLTRSESFAKQLRRQGKTLRQIMRAVAVLADSWEVPQPYMTLSRIGNRTFPTTWSAVPFTARKRAQIAAMRAGLEGDADLHNAARRTLLQWLSKGQLRRRNRLSPPPEYLCVWVDQEEQCSVCGHQESMLRKFLTRRDVRVQITSLRGSCTLGAKARRIYGAAMIGSLLTATWLFPSREVRRGYCRGCKRFRPFRVVDSRRVPEAEVATLLSAVADQPPLKQSQFLSAWLGKDGTPK